MRLYEIPEAFREIEAAIEVAEGEITPEIQAALDAAEGQVAEKVDAICGLIREAEGNALAADEEVKRIRRIADAQRNLAGRLKSYLLRWLSDMDMDRCRTGTHVVSRRKSASPRISWSKDLALLPSRFLRRELALDGKAAHQAYAEGELPEGFDVTFTEYLEMR